MATHSPIAGLGGILEYRQDGWDAGRLFLRDKWNQRGKKIMSKSGPIIALLFALSLLTACVADRQNAGGQFIYGKQIMTAEELAAYRQALATAETELDRQFYLDAHHKKMAARAEEQGIVLAEKAVASKPKRRKGKPINTGSRLGR